MERVVVAILIILVAVGFIIFNTKKSEDIKPLPKQAASPTGKKAVLSSLDKEQKSIFIPYWALTSQTIPIQDYNEFIYFGITPGNSGIDKTEQGFLGLKRFSATRGLQKNTQLTLRMINADSNFSILKDKNSQEKIILETIEIAKKYNFSGIVLDLEVSSLPFASVTEQINSFVKDFNTKAKKENLSFSIMLFGDTFYRLRSYDVFSLVKNTDKIFVMAYDFHKAAAQAGPNFPLNGKETYGYDFKSMVNDFLNIVKPEKLTIVFGMFGYDWTVDQNNISEKPAQSLSLYAIKEKFIQRCRFSNCKVERDKISAETNVQYLDDAGNKHVVWFEDETSVLEKKKFLEEKRIKSTSFWAYSYY